MNLPNKLTILRIILVPFFVFFMLLSGDIFPHHNLVALAIFGIASYTDHLDGKIARRDHLITNFGKLMDPLADKILVMSALICMVKLALVCFVANGMTNTVFVLLIMVREFAVTSIRLIAVEQGRVIPANNWGKAKTVSQIVAICIVLLTQYILDLGAYGILALPTETLSPIFTWMNFVVMAIATLLAVVSGIIYAKDAKDLFTEL